MSIHDPRRWWVQVHGRDELDLLHHPEPMLGVFAFRARGLPAQLIATGLPSLHPAVEAWRAFGKIRAGQIGAARFVADDDVLLAELKLNEADCGGLRRTVRDGFRRLVEYTASSAHPFVQKVWCHFSAINAGQGDEERYKQFCVGRAEGLGEHWQADEPAATVIGRPEYDPTVHLIWLASVRKGEAIDNPRQTPPRSYPRTYGPSPPRFARARLLRGFYGDALLISGTASVVGADSQHPGNLALQFAETKQNLDVLLNEAARRLKAVAEWGKGTVLRVYVRREEDLPNAEALVKRFFPPGVQAVVLCGEICRRELLVEIEAIQQW